MKGFKLFCYLLVIFTTFLNFNINVYAENYSQSEIFLYGFGDDYESDDFLTLYNTKTCYVSIKNIPITEKENIRLTIKNENVAEIQDITYGNNSNTVITAKIKGKNLGTTDIIASLIYNGVNYTSTITTTVHESNYRISLHREDNLDSEETSMKKGENLKLVASLTYGMSSHVGDISSNKVMWSSSNENVIKVDNNGLVTAIEKGVATITAKYETNEGVTIIDSYDIEVVESNETLVFSAKGYTNLPVSLRVGEKLELLAAIKYKGDSSGLKDIASDSIIWTSSNENIAQIDNKGLVTALSKGTVTITAKYNTEENVLTNTLTFTIIDLDKNPNTGAFLPFTILAGGILLVGILIVTIKGKDKLYHI